jgi:ribonuclease-3
MKKKLPDFEEFEKNAGLKFNDKTLLKTAFAHRSFIKENRGVVPEHNERLEFLGDAVLELASSDFLYKKYPKKPEGELTALRAALVNTQSIYSAAKNLNMNEYLLLSKGEAKDTGRARQFILADSFEALIGAIYLDQGYKAAREFIARNLFGKIDEIVEKKLWQDPKSRFQEISQDTRGITPRYELVQEIGPDHNKRFISVVILDDEKIAQGEGKSKQEKALEVLGWDY